MLGEVPYCEIGIHFRPSYIRSDLSKVRKITIVPERISCGLCGRASTRTYFLIIQLYPIDYCIFSRKYTNSGFLIQTESFPDQLHITEITSTPVENKKLRRLVSSIDPETSTSCYNSIRQRYKIDLEASLDAFHKKEEHVQPSTIPYDLATIKSCFDSSKQYLSGLHERICIASQPNTPSSTLLNVSGFWPRFTLVDLLGLLASTHHMPTDMQWIDCLIGLGRAVTICQRARRLVLAAEAGHISSFFSEINHLGYTEWDPKVLPEWLLFEIDNDLLIRPIQARVAREMLSPSCSSNMLTQLNMGVSRLSFSVML